MALTRGGLHALRPPERMLVGYFGRMMPGVTLTSEALRPLKTMLLAGSGLIALHVAAVVYTALHGPSSLAGRPRPRPATPEGPGAALSHLRRGFGVHPGE